MDQFMDVLGYIILLAQKIDSEGYARRVPQGGNPERRLSGSIW